MKPPIDVFDFLAGDGVEIELTHERNISFGASQRLIVSATVREGLPRCLQVDSLSKTETQLDDLV